MQKKCAQIPQTYVNVDVQCLMYIINIVINIFHRVPSLHSPIQNRKRYQLDEVQLKKLKNTKTAPVCFTGWNDSSMNQTVCFTWILESLKEWSIAFVVITMWSFHLHPTKITYLAKLGQESSLTTLGERLDVISQVYFLTLARCQMV